MTNELELKLEEKYPFMRRGRTLEEQKKENGRIFDLYGAFGCCCGDGWFQLLCDLCEEITVAYEKAGAEIDLVPVQIKEKFGSLRFYYDIKGRKKTIHAIDFLGEGSIRYADSDMSIYKEIRNIVDKYEHKSLTVCEKCGEDGELRKDLPWIATLCRECYQKELNRKNNREDRK